MNEEWLIGKNPIIEAFRSGRPINKLFIGDYLKQNTIDEIQQLARKQGVQIKRVPKQKLDQLTKGKHQGLVAAVAAYEYASIDDLFARAEQRGELPFFILLDGILDPHNLGSILRTADATGVHGVIIPKNRAVGLTSVVAKTSAGAIEYVPVARVTNMAQTIEELKSRNVWVVGTEMEADKDYRELEGDIAIALVIGNEGKGISRLVLDKCDWTVNLSMKGQVSSLNASVACGVLMYEILRKRHPLGG